MKIFKAVSLFALFLCFSYALQAQNTTCTVTTPCNTYTFNNVQGGGTSSTSTPDGNGGFDITIFDGNGNVLATENCQLGSQVTSACGSGGGDDICDSLVGAPQWVLNLYGCN